MPPPAAAAGVDDWQHIWEVVQRDQLLQARPTPPAAAMVYYLGDSIARESTVSDSSWNSQAKRRASAAAARSTSGPSPLAGHNQTFGMDEDHRQGACPGLRAGQPKGILLIGVGISRFIGPPTHRTRMPSTRRRAPPCPSTAPAGPASLRRARRRSPKRARASSCRAGCIAAGPASCTTRARTSTPSPSDHQDRQGEGSPPRASSTCRLTSPSCATASTSRGTPSAPAAAVWPRIQIKYLGFTGAIGLPSSGALGPSPPAAPRLHSAGSRALSAELVRMLPKASATL